MCGCVSQFAVQLLFVCLSDPNRKKETDRERKSAKTSNAKGIARKAQGQWRIRGRKGRERERRDDAEQLLWAL